MAIRYWHQFEMRQLHYFSEVVAEPSEKKSFSKAAERLEIEQSYLSKTIAALETNLGVKLFDRSRRPPVLTVAGKAFAKELEQATIGLERSIARTQKANRGEVGKLVIVVNTAIANSLLPVILRTFRDRYPEVTLELKSMTIDDMTQGLRDGSVDVGFGHLPNPYAKDPSFNFLPIVPELFVVALPEQHPLATQSHITLQSLKNEPLILPPLSAVPSYAVVLSKFEQMGHQPTVIETVKATWIVVNLSLVAAGVGISILPDNVQTIQRQGVVYRNLEDDSLLRYIAVVWRRESSSEPPTALSTRSKVLHRFLITVQETAKDYSSSTSEVAH